MIHVLIAVVEIPQRGAHLIACTSGDARLIQTVQTDVDPRRLGNRGGLSKAPDAAGFVQPEHDEISCLPPTNVVYILRRKDQLIRSDRYGARALDLLERGQAVAVGRLF